MEVRPGANPADVKNYDTDRLRHDFLVQDLFVADEIKTVYSQIDRIIVGAATPAKKTLVLEAGAELRAKYFLERREMGIINIGGNGTVTVDGKDYKFKYKDGMYIGMGAKEIKFASDDAANPAKFYFNSAPAHKTYPTVFIDPAKDILPENKKELVIVEDEAEVIRRVFELTNQRYSKMEICKLFNEEGVLTPLQSMSRRQKSDSKKAASRGLQWTSDMIRKIVDDKTYIGCMVYGKTKIPEPGTGKEVPVPRNQWKVMENHHEPIVSKDIFEKAQSLQIRYTKKSKFDREITLLGGYVKCGNCHRSLTSSSPVHGHILYSCAYSKGKEDTGCFAGKADNKMLEHIVLAEIKAYLRQNISQEQMQQSMRKQHEDSIEAYKTESADCEKRQEQIKIQNRQNYEKYHEGQMNQKQFMEAKKQLEEERERLQKRVQELDELINGEKEILMKKNVPVEQMLKYLGYEKLTREMLEEYVQGIYVYDDGRVEVEWRALKLAR